MSQRFATCLLSASIEALVLQKIIACSSIEEFTGHLWLAIPDNKCKHTVLKLDRQQHFHLTKSCTQAQSSLIVILKHRKQSVNLVDGGHEGAGSGPVPCCNALQSVHGSHMARYLLVHQEVHQLLVGFIQRGICSQHWRTCESLQVQASPCARQPACCCSTCV